MNMLQHWHEAIESLNLDPSTPILVACSGGVDSMVMLRLFRDSGFEQIHIAHVNFQLRKAESDADEALVLKIGKRYNWPIHIRHFQTEQYAMENGISIQMAARELRYKWFDELCEMYGISYIATAHHLDDQVETVLMNILRGTRHRGLEGMKMQGGNRIRPLLNIRKSSIEAYARENKIIFREDKSNQSLKYHRNRIRHSVLPELDKINPQTSEHIAQLAEYMQRYNRLLSELLQPIYQNYRSENGRIIIPTPRSESESMALEMYLLEHGFQEPEKILRTAQENRVGAEFQSDRYKLLTDREEFILKENFELSAFEFVFESPSDVSIEPVALRWEQCDRAVFDQLDDFESSLVFDASSVSFPVLLRRWRPGDRFRPLGMRGTKKVKDFLTDRKVDRFTKAETAVLESNGRIIAVVGHCVDDQCKVVETTEMVYIARF